MVTFAQAQERAEEWINGDVPSYQHREVRVREFELGFVVWGEDRADGPRSDAGGQRLVLARDTGEATLWPALPVGEVIRRYEEEYGRPDEAGAPVPAPAAARVDLNQTSFLLSPPEWLQEAADRMGIPDRRSGEGAGADSGAGVGSGSAAAADAVAAPAAAAPPSPSPSAAGASGSGAGFVPGVAPSPGGLAETQAGVPAAAAGRAGATGGEQEAPAGATPWTGTDTNTGGTGAVAGARDTSGQAAPWSGADAPTGGTGAGSGVRDASPGATPWAGTDTNAEAGEDRSVPLPATVFAPPLSEQADEPPRPPAAAPDAKTALMSGGSQLPRTRVSRALDDSSGPGAPAAPVTPGAPQGSTPPPGPASYGYPEAPAAQAAPGTPPPGAPAYAPAHGTPPAPPVPGSGAPQGSTPPPYGYPQAPAPGGDPNAAQSQSGSAVPGRPLAPNAGDIADAATSKAAPPPRKGRAGAGAPPPPPGAPGAPGGRPGSTPPPPAPAEPGTPPGGYVRTQLVSALGPDGQPEVPAAPGAPSPPSPPGAPGGTPPGNVHHAATVFADPSLLGGPGPVPPPPNAPGAPGAPGTPPPPPPAPGMPNPPGAPGTPGMPAAPGAPQPPGAPGAPGARGAVHHAETVLAAPPVAGPGAPPPPPAPGVPGMPPGAPGAPGVPGVPGMPPGPGAPGGPGMPPPVPGAPGMAQPTPPGAMPPAGVPLPGQAGAYGYPPQGQPTVGPGYQAVLRYRAQDGSEQQLIRRSAPGTPHPEWQIFHELRAMNVPADQVLELHTELESCELPGAYCARMIREQWPQARITSIAPYGTDHASRQQGMQQLLAHQGELHQVADGPARPAPVRAPLPPVQPVPPVPPEAIGQELAGVFGPGVFRFEQQAVSRQGVPPVVAHTLVAAGLPVDLGPFFWAQAQPGRPVPTLAELAAERGVQPAPDAGSYLVMGTDFGRAVCVQYGTANIVAVPVEAGPGGAPVAPQFVNSGLPEFARCLALLGRMWRLRYGLNQEQAGRWTVDFQAQLSSLDPAALASPESWWSVLLEQMWDGLL
ncbi:SUKH-4 family immunity protein [Streptomyces sp. NPDC047028]|uniref:SUKH-4 family immunity protein n=1 Tax=Streptomyces sp. NPDC047028 TaxID=3155793 RepID=UPI003410FE9A